MGISLSGLNSGVGDVYSNLLSSGASSAGGAGGFDGSSLLSDYASIKNGSYGKMMKAYYAKQKAANEDESSVSEAKKSQKTKDAASASAARKFYETSSKMNNLDYSEGNIDKLYDEVSAFIKDYNSFITTASKSKNSSVQAQADALNDYTYQNYKLFAKIGITMNSDRTLSIDEDTFKKVNEKTGATNVPTMKTLFQGNNSFASRAADRASKIYRTAGDGEAVTSSKAKYAGTTGSVSSTDSASKKEASKTVKDDSAANLANALYKSVNNLGNMEINNHNMNIVYGAVSTMVNDYNSVIKKACASDNSNDKSQVGYLKDLINSNKSAFAKMGITVNSDKSLSLDETKFKESDMSNVKNMFTSVYSFSEKMTDRVNKIYRYATQGESLNAKSYTSQGNYGSVDTGTILDAIT